MMTGLTSVIVGALLSGTLAAPPAEPTAAGEGNVGEPIYGWLPGGAGASPAAFTVTDPKTLPPGVGLNSVGKLTGIPTVTGTFTTKVKACLSGSCTAGTLTLKIGPDRSACVKKSSAPPIS